MLAFDPAAFKSNYPVFGSLEDGYLIDVFNYEALVMGKVVYGLFVTNSIEEFYWANKVLAHCLVLSNGQSGQQNGIGKVGIITNAGEGSITGGFQVPDMKDPFYWRQTSYGTAVYNLLTQRGGFQYHAQASGSATISQWPVGFLGWC